MIRAPVDTLFLPRKTKKFIPHSLRGRADAVGGQMRKRTYQALDPALVQYKPSADAEDDTPPAHIHNLVGTTTLYCSSGSIKLDHIAALLPNTYYDKSRFAAISLRIYNPSTTALLFSSGKLVLTGATSWCQCLLASLHIARLLSSCCPGTRFAVLDTTVQNIVGNVVVPLPPDGFLDLAAMYSEMSTVTTWQRQMFPGLVMRCDGPVVLLLFFSGRVVVTGGKTERDIHQGWRNLWPIVKRYVRAGGESRANAPPPRKRRRAAANAAPR